jgi:hypothetical protein
MRPARTADLTVIVEPNVKDGNATFHPHLKVVGCQPCAPAAFTGQEIFLVPISVTAESIPGAMVRSEGLSIKNANDTVGN